LTDGQRFCNLVRDFQSFYSLLSNKTDIFYMFFTTEMLQWVTKSCAFVPEKVNLIIISAGLADEERIWVNENLLRPAFHIDKYVDDKTVWKMLFKVNQYNFGWLDADCFVLNSSLFREMTEFTDDVAINCMWTCRYEDYLQRSNEEYVYSYKDFRLLRTHFLFINIQIYKEMISRDIPISPSTYTDKLSHAGRGTTARFEESLNGLYSEVLSPAHYKALSAILPRTQEGKTRFHRIHYLDEELIFLDTLHMYQILAHYYGYKLRSLRNLNVYSTIESYFSNEVLHVGDISQYKVYPFLGSNLNFTNPNDFFNPSMIRYEFILLLELLLLQQSSQHLPPMYSALYRTAKIHVNKYLPISVDAAGERISSILASAGLNPYVIHEFFSDAINKVEAD